eukprot:gene6189-6425_t
MDPKMMELAMEQMMQSMMSSMGNMNPAMMQTAMQQMQNMSPAELELARQQMNSMDPAAIANQAQEASNMMSARQQYVINGSKLLKADGNRLHTAGKYAEAAEKYERARTNLAELSGSAEAADLLKACTLNLGSCYLQLGRFHDAVSACDEILERDTQNVKALYRRGQAHAALQQHEAALSDLQASLVLSAHDPQQQQLIREKLGALPHTLAAGQQQQQQTVQLETQQIDVSGQQAPVAVTGGPAAGATTAGVAEDLEDGLIEEVVDEDASATKPALQQQQQQPPHVSNITQRQTNSGSTSAPGAMWAGDGMPRQMQQAAEMMRQHPDMMRQAAEMMKSMTPAQIAAISQQAGTPLEADSIAEAQRQMAALTPGQVESMAKLSSMGPSALDSPDARKQAAKMMQDPEMMKAAATMMQSMPKEQLQEMAAVVGSQLDHGPRSGTAGAAADVFRAGLSDSNNSRVSAAPPQVSAPGCQSVHGAGAPDMAAMMTPEMMQAASKMMATMKQEDLHAMQQMLGGGGPTGGPAGFAPNMMSAAMTPQMMEGMITMMQGMDEAMLAQMVKGMVGGDDQKAALIAKQLKQMSPTQLRLMKTAAVCAQAGAQTADQIGLHHTQQSTGGLSYQFFGGGCIHHTGAGHVGQFRGEVRRSQAGAVKGMSASVAYGHMRSERPLSQQHSFNTSQCGSQGHKVSQACYERNRQLLRTHLPVLQALTELNEELIKQMRDPGVTAAMAEGLTKAGAEKKVQLGSGFIHDAAYLPPSHRW